jgi:hypothetical protein
LPGQRAQIGLVGLEDRDGRAHGPVDLRSRRTFPQEDGERFDFWQLRHSIDCAAWHLMTGTPGLP